MKKISVKPEKRSIRASRLEYILMILPLVLIVLAGCYGNQAAVTAKLGESFTIGIGESAQITGQDMLITFKEVIGDSRCAQGAQCIWAGVVSSSVKIKHKGADYALALNLPGLTEQARETFVDFTLTFSVSPYPKVNETIAAKDYKLTLTITK